jgi:hypothetical protein
VSISIGSDTGIDAAFSSFLSVPLLTVGFQGGGGGSVDIISVSASPNFSSEIVEADDDDIGTFIGVLQLGHATCFPANSGFAWMPLPQLEHRNRISPFFVMCAIF